TPTGAFWRGRWPRYGSRAEQAPPTATTRTRCCAWWRSAGTTPPRAWSKPCWKHRRARRRPERKEGSADHEGRDVHPHRGTVERDRGVERVLARPFASLLEAALATVLGDVEHHVEHEHLAHRVGRG